MGAFYCEALKCNILPNVHSDHSAVLPNIIFEDDSPTRGPGFWKFNIWLLLDINYTELLTLLLPEIVTKHC